MSDHHEVKILSDKKLTITLPDSADGATFTFKPNEVEELTIVQQPCGDCARLRDALRGLLETACHDQNTYSDDALRAFMALPGYEMLDPRGLTEAVLCARAVLRSPPPAEPGPSDPAAPTNDANDDAP